MQAQEAGPRPIAAIGDRSFSAPTFAAPGRALFAWPRAGAMRCVTRQSLVLLAGDMAVGMAALTMWPGAGLAGTAEWALVLLACIAASHAAGLYSIRLRQAGWATYPARLLLAVAAVLVMLLVAQKAGVMNASHAGVLSLLAGVSAWKLVAETALFPAVPPLRVIVLGGGAAGLAARLRQEGDIRVAAVLGEDPQRWSSRARQRRGDECPALLRLAVRQRADMVVVAGPRPYREEVSQQLLACQYAGLRVADDVEMLEIVTGRLPLDLLQTEWMVTRGDLFCRHSRVSSRIKRLLDIGAAAAILLATLPLLLVAIIAIRLESPGPVFYRQQRVGLFGRQFRICKLRTMRTDAERDGPVWAARQDSRVTRVGAVLRKFRVDELPQLLNVIVGDMSLIGPRPERPEFVGTLREQIAFYDLRHGLRPGITGWAQVSYPYGACVGDAAAKLEYDLFYIRHWSLWFDLRIALRTLRTVVTGQGAH